MLVFEYKQKIRLKKNIPYEFVSENIAYFIDSALAKEEKYLEFHNGKEYKNYVFDLLYPCEMEREYKSGKIYFVYGLHCGMSGACPHSSAAFTGKDGADAGSAESCPQRK